MMTRMVMQRIGIGLATLWVVSVIVFIATSILPGDVAEIILGQAQHRKHLAALRAELGLDQPGYVFATSAGWVTWSPATSVSPRRVAQPFPA